MVIMEESVLGPITFSNSIQIVLQTVFLLRMTAMSESGLLRQVKNYNVVGKALITDDIQLTGSNPRIDFNTNGVSALRFYDTTNSAERMRIASDGEIRVAGQTLVDSANTNYKMTFPDNSGIAMGSAYTYANIYGSGGNLYLKANAYAANLGNNPSKYIW